MFTSRTLAPPRTCSSATSTAPAKSSASTRRRKRAEPVTFVRSPISTKPVSGVISKARGRSGARAAAARAAGAGRSPATAAAIAAVCAGVEPQQLPAMLRRPSSAKPRISDAGHLGRLVVAAERVREAGVRVGADEAGRDPRELGEVGPHLARPERAVDADDQRLGVRDRGPRTPRSSGPRASGPRGRRSSPRSRAGAPARPRARRGSPPSRSACRRSSRAAAGRRRPRRARAICSA